MVILNVEIQIGSPMRCNVGLFSSIVSILLINFLVLASIVVLTRNTLAQQAIARMLLSRYSYAKLKQTNSVITANAAILGAHVPLKPASLTAYLML